MTLLVTGGAGFIGSALVRMALSNGRNVVNVDSLTYASNLENLSPVLPSENYAFEKVDIRNAEDVKRVFKTRHDLATVILNINHIY